MKDLFEYRDVLRDGEWYFLEYVNANGDTVSDMVRVDKSDGDVRVFFADGHFSVRLSRLTSFIKVKSVSPVSIGNPMSFKDLIWDSLKKNHFYRIVLKGGDEDVVVFQHNTLFSVFSGVIYPNAKRIVSVTELELKEKS